MNCANHPSVAAASYCRTCGKALCQSCARSVHGVIYCENCLAARLEGVQPPTPPPAMGFNPPTAAVQPAPAPAQAGPNPALAGILAGFFPFGVGAVYCGQYAKGLAHLLIFTGLVWGLSSGAGDLAPVLGIGMGFFCVYQIIDAVRSAKAIQMGQPAPDPFGFGRAFSPGEKLDTAKVPTAALVLIGLGVLFLLHTMAGFAIGAEWIVPCLLILLGGWLFARRFGLLGPVDSEACRRSVMGPAILVTIGGLWILHNVREIGFFSWVGVLLIVIGLIRVLQGNAPGASSPGAPPPAGPAAGVVGGEVQSPSTEVKNG
jgi:hypothetical protein